MNIIDRIRQINHYKSISARQFCIEVGIANGYLDKVKDVGSEKLLKILNRYPEISPEWLLTGKGEMLRICSESKPNPESKPEQQQNIQPLANLLEKMHAEVTDLTNKLHFETSNLATQLSSKSAENHHLLERILQLESEIEQLKGELKKERENPPRLGAKYATGSSLSSLVAEPEPAYEKNQKKGIPPSI